MDRLIRKYRPLIKKLCAGYARLREDAEDLEAITLLTACKRFDSYDPARGGFGTWLGAIVRNEAAEMRRRAKRQPVCVPSSVLTEAVLDTAVAPDVAYFKAYEPPPLIGPIPSTDWSSGFNLTPLLKRAFELVKLQGLTCAEAGAVLGRTEGTVRTYIWKARQKMRSVEA